MRSGSNAGIPSICEPIEIADSVGAILTHKGSVFWSIASDSMVFDAIQLSLWLKKMSARCRW
jgi:hypothetical protein